MEPKRKPANLSQDRNSWVGRKQYALPDWLRFNQEQESKNKSTGPQGPMNAQAKAHIQKPFKRIWRGRSEKTRMAGVEPVPWMRPKIGPSPGGPSGVKKPSKWWQQKHLPE